MLSYGINFPVLGGPPSVVGGRQKEETIEH